MESLWIKSQNGFVGLDAFNIRQFFFQDFNREKVPGTGCIGISLKIGNLLSTEDLLNLTIWQGLICSRGRTFGNRQGVEVIQQSFGF